MILKKHIIYSINVYQHVKNLIMVLYFRYILYTYIKNNENKIIETNKLEIKYDEETGKKIINGFQIHEIIGRVLHLFSRAACSGPRGRDYPGRKREPDTGIRAEVLRVDRAPAP